MKQKTVVIVLLILLFFTGYFTSLVHIETGQAAVLPKFYVDDDYDSNTSDWQETHFDKIQDAINKSSDGDRIIVYEGEYHENLHINRTSLHVFGDDTNPTIVGTGGRDVVIISDESVNLSHFTINSSGSNTENNSLIRVNAGNAIIHDNILNDGQNGITIYGCNNNMIYANTIQNNDGDGIQLNQSNNNEVIWNTIKGNANGMLLYTTSQNTIENNTIQTGSTNGIFLNRTCNSNTIKNNNISSNDENGMYLSDRCNNNNISNNEIYANVGTGIRIENSSINNMSANTIASNIQYGIMVSGSNNIIWTNTVTSNKRHGMFLFADDNTNIHGNAIMQNTYEGIRSYNSTSNIIKNNEIYSNSRYGIYLDLYTIDNLIYNNFFHDNTYNAMDKSTNRNSWNTSQTSGTNIIGGPNLSGNYWDDYTGSDSNNDGIGDTPYTIYAGNKDKGPLIDVISPVISNIQVSPSSQTRGEKINISAKVIDTVAVIGVYVIVTDPSNQVYNFSITQNKTGNTYTHSYRYTSVGTYSFYIGAKDTRNWASSSSRSFRILEGVAPTIVDNSPSTGSPAEAYTFNATVTDDLDSASDLTVKVQWRHGKYRGNYSLVNINNNFFVIAVTLDHSINNLTYNFWASDQWGNSVVTAQKKVSIIDNERPTIVINQYGPSFDDLPNSYTFNATITDNVAVSKALIEYWYNGSDHLTVEMDQENNYYKKVIVPTGKPDTMYCIIYANDTSGNQNNTKKPTAIITDGPYSGVVSIPIAFNANQSFDLDGTIKSYTWDFNDGTTGTGITPTYTYSAKGNYTITLNVTDNDGNAGETSTYVNVISLLKIQTSSKIMTTIEEDYGVTLNEPFYSYDTDGDGIVDTFVDPNDVLTAVHTGYVNISGNVSFLLSVNDTLIPEFFWNATTNTIIPVIHKQGVLNKTIIDEENNNATLYVFVNKTNNWLYIEVPDAYPKANLTVKAGDRTIALERIWRKNDNVYVFDDPDTEYLFLYQNIFQPPDQPTFDPVNGGVINEDTPTITISYAVTVRVLDASFGTLAIDPDDLVTTDNKVFSYTPPAYLQDDTYEFFIFVEDEHGNEIESSVIYFYFSYAQPPEEAELPLLWILVGIVAGGATLFLVFRYKQITFDDFIYVKKQKIAPFVKPFVVGPMSVHVDDDRISKAEFYVDGKLKETLTNPPYLWKWNETTFSKHTIETKVYDDEGNSSSSGTMEFYMVNSARLFK